MEDTPVITEAPATAAPAPAAADGTTPKPDLSNVTLEQLDTLMTGGNIEVPVLGGGGETGQEPAPKPAAKVEEPAGDTPLVDETPAAVIEEEVVETRSPEEIQAAVDAAVAQVVTDGGDQAAQDAAAALAAAPVAPVAEPVIEPAQPQGIERPRLKDERDQLIAGVYMHAKREAEAGRGTAITWAEAEARVDGPKSTIEAEPVVEAPDFGAVVGTLEGEIAAMETELAGFESGLFTPEVSKLMRNISAKQNELALAKRDQQQATQQAERDRATALAASKENRSKSHAQAIAEYPSVADDTTPLGAAVAARVRELKNPQHPDHRLLVTDSAPLLIARDVAAELGIAPVARKKAALPAKPPIPAAPPRKVMAPAPGSKTAVAPAQPAEDAKAQLKQALNGEVSLEDLDRLQGVADPSKLLAGAVR